MFTIKDTFIRYFDVQHKENNAIFKKSIDSIINAESVTYKEELASQVQAWDGEQRFVTKHAKNLLQLPVERQIPPTGWKCDLCDKRENLWLNLVNTER